jgi:hypothetical protein
MTGSTAPTIRVLRPPPLAEVQRYVDAADKAKFAEQAIAKRKVRKAQ